MQKYPRLPTLSSHEGFYATSVSVKGGKGVVNKPAKGIQAAPSRKFIVPGTPGLNFLSAPVQYIEPSFSSGLSTNQIIVLLLIGAAVYYYYNKEKTTFRIRRGFY